ncbi:glycosyltransferase family 39 protein [Tahibacter amnicola]|uniref:Glycosyltransferase family 39 protein n=1 Tax=Tahibacter amnicola TaxID=2976241 RepID=A0ABY6BCW3_9GAMM|nr:glycosyltransferase family 39 protein [Tahibacter amnicola]UXI67694.1 glycosyltransferase family 39 protein [Tahibacter amnicola]
MPGEIDGPLPSGGDPAVTAPRPATPRLSDGALLRLLLAGVFVLRLVHLSFAVRSPTMFRLGSDESYYLEYAQQLLAGGNVLAGEYLFMDPLYAYLIAASVALSGGIFPLLLAQVVADTATAGVLFAIARDLGNRTTGIVAVVLYGLCATAIFYSATLLREVWVVLYIVIWLWWGRRVWATPSIGRGVAFGLYCGLGVALRSNLVLAGIMAVVLLPLLQWRQSPGSGRWRASARLATSIAAGFAVSIFLLASRNGVTSGEWTPLPTNGGAVLHHAYNAENPQGHSVLPDFVAYASPSDMWRGYRDEAVRRVGHELTPVAVSRYWSAQALDYVQAHPGLTARNLLRKTGEFLAYPEFGNNRSIVDEQLFSPLLRVLPLPFGVLIALGLPGLLLAWRDARAWPLLFWFGFSLATFVVFYAESRFRFLAVPVLCIGAGVWVNAMWQAFASARVGVTVTLGAAAALLGASSWYLAAFAPRPVVDWHRIAWGYATIGQVQLARDWASRGLEHQPGDAHELLGYIALLQDSPALAVTHYQEAVARQPAGRYVIHYNLALALARTGRLSDAVASAERAAQSGLPDPVLLWADLLVANSEPERAASVYARWSALTAQSADAQGARARLAAKSVTLGQDP